MWEDRNKIARVQMNKIVAEVIERAKAEFAQRAEVTVEQLEAIKITAEKVNQIVTEAEADWTERNIVKPRNTLPLPISAGCFKRLRQAACKYAGVQNCGCLNQGEWNLPQNGNPCETCNTPGMSSLEFSETLFGQGFNKGKYVGPVISDRTIQRWLNAKSPAHPATIITALGRAWRRGWISGNTAYNLAKDVAMWGGILTAVRQRKKLANKDIAVEFTNDLSDTPLAGLAENQKGFYKAHSCDAFGSSATKVRQNCVSEGANIC